MRDVGTLLEALPYIREFHGKTVVIKYGGAAMEDPELREEFARDVVLLKYVGMNPIVVHGGGPDITRYMERLDMPVEFVGGLRVSDADTVEIAKMVLVGKVNKDIVLRLGRHGQPAVGLCGDDGLLFRVATMEGPEGEDIGLVGPDRARRRRRDPPRRRADYIPVIASVGADRHGRSHNVNADEAAGAVARALGAYKVIFLTDVAGWLADPADPDSVISETTADDVEAALPRARRRHAPEARGLPERDPRRRRLRAHHRRPPAALAAARAVHRRRHRHQGAPRPVSGALMNNYARFPVEFVRGEGATLWDAEGNEYLDFLAGISVCNTGHCHPARGGGDPRSRRGTLIHVSNLFFNRPMVALAERLSAALARRPRLLRQLRRGGERGGAQARPQGAPARRDRRAARRLPRPHVRRALRDAPGVQAGAVRAARARLRARRRATPEALDAAVHDGTAAVLIEPIQGETGVNVLPDELLRAARAACDRTGAALVFDEIQTGMGRTGTLWAYEADRRRARRDHGRPRRSAAGCRSAR